MVRRNTYYYIVSFWHLGPIFRGKKWVSGRVLPPGWWRSLGRRGVRPMETAVWAACILQSSGFQSTRFKRSIRKTLGNFPTEHRGMPFAYCIWLYSQVDCMPGSQGPISDCWRNWWSTLIWWIEIHKDSIQVWLIATEGKYDSEISRSWGRTAILYFSNGQISWCQTRSKYTFSECIAGWTLGDIWTLKGTVFREKLII